MDIRAVFALVVDFEASWCEHLITPSAGVVDIAFPDDPFLFETISHPGMVFCSELLRIPEAAIRIKLTSQNVTIIAECENELKSHEVNKEIWKCIRGTESVFNLVLKDS